MHQSGVPLNSVQTCKAMQTAPSIPTIKAIPVQCVRYHNTPNAYNLCNINVLCIRANAWHDNPWQASAQWPGWSTQSSDALVQAPITLFSV
jgi:hypothetical protein